MTPRLLVVGASENEQEVLLTWIGALPAELAFPIVVVRHACAGAPPIRAALEARSALPVHELEDKAPLVAGTVHVAPPDYHVLVEDVGRVAMSTEQPLWGARPAIDPLFESAADAYGPGAIGVLLDEAGPDGIRGLTRIAERGGVALSKPLVADVVALLSRMSSEAT